MDVDTLEQWLWDAACEIRRPIDAPKFKGYILPLVFLKRLSDIFDDEVARIADEFGDSDKAQALAKADHSLVRFYIPSEARSRIGVEAKEVHLRNMKRKWACGSNRGRLTFDKTLLAQPADKRTEVIVHELVHLKIGNHGPLFRSLVRAHLAGSKKDAIRDG